MPLALDIVAPPVSGPSSARRLVSVAAGAYTEITRIIAPSSAIAGKLVAVDVKVKNLHNINIYIAVTGLYDTAELASSPEYISVAPGATYTFTLSFIMPNRDIRVWAFSHYWTGTDWYQDDEGYIDIALAAVWIKLATETITLTPEIVEWTKLASKSITLTPEVVPPVEWVKLASKKITLTPTEVVPPPECITDADCPPGYVCVDGVCIPKEEVEEKKFPWALVLIGGGALIAVAGLAAAKKKR